jgi:hypothetical protein
MNMNPTDYMADGNRIVRAQNIGGGGMLYEINGVIATPQQRVSVSQMKYVAAADEVVLVPLPGPSTTVTKKVYYAPDGTPDGVSETSVTTETVR